MGMKQKKIKKTAHSKQTEIFKITNSQKKIAKFQGLVLGLVGLIDAMGIDVAQPIWLHEIFAKNL
jgi:hypothetical protein